MMDIPKEHLFLDRLVEKACGIDPKIRGLAINGHCDAFALALKDVLAEHMPQLQTTLVVIQRTRVSRRNSKRVFDDNPLSHVILDVGSTRVDVDGIDADENWENNWIQPGRHDEAVPCEDLFDYVSVTDEELIALRQLRDQRSPSNANKKKFTAVLNAAVKELAVAARRVKSPRR